jgi:hypothetical protein
MQNTPVDLAELLNEPGRRLAGNLGEFDLALHSQ